MSLKIYLTKSDKIIYEEKGKFYNSQLSEIAEPEIKLEIPDDMFIYERFALKYYFKRLGKEITKDTTKTLKRIFT